MVSAETHLSGSADGRLYGPASGLAAAVGLVWGLSGLTEALELPGLPDHHQAWVPAGGVPWPGSATAGVGVSGAPVAEVWWLVVEVLGPVESLV